MSARRQRRSPKNVRQEPRARRGTAAALEGAAGSGITPSDGELIRFDRRTQIVLGTLLALLALATVFKVHGSSIGSWSPMVGASPNTGLVAGQPKTIRSDEWAFGTPMMISQAESQPAFPASNPGWGPGKVPLIIDMPARHWSMLARPQFWGFFVLDLERGFAFAWWMKAVLLIGGVFLLLMLLTENCFAASLPGALWVYFSGFTQWWYSTTAMLPEMIGCMSLCVVAAHYLALSRHKWVIALSALLVSLCLVDFALSCYPPFQVPLCYLGLAILAGSLSARLWKARRAEQVVCRCAGALLAVAVAGVLLGLFYSDAKETLHRARGTVYPGARLSLGGDVPLAQLFSGFYGFFMSQATVPRIWGNACEASNFVLLFPVPMAALGWAKWRERSVSPAEWSLVAYLLVVVVWMTVGGPRAFAVLSAFGLSHDTRWLIGVGPASILLCCMFLARARDERTDGLGWKLAATAAAIALLPLFSVDFNRVTTDFANPSEIFFVTIGVAAATYLLLAKRRAALFSLILIPSVWSFGLLNPIATGLGPILKSQPFQQARHIVEGDPKAGWAVYGSFTAANLLKAAGARVFNGTKVVPPLEQLRILDPDSSAASVYNRYAHIQLAFEGGSDIRFFLQQADLYTITIDPRNDALRRIGIQYVVLPGNADDATFLSMATLVRALPENGIWIYKYKWKPDAGED